MDGLWATKSEGVGLIVRAIISLQDFLTMWSWSTNVTDGQTDRQTSCNRKTALCAIVHRAVKINQIHPGLYLSYFCWRIQRSVTSQSSDEKVNFTAIKRGSMHPSNKIDLTSCFLDLIRRSAFSHRAGTYQPQFLGSRQFSGTKKSLFYGEGPEGPATYVTIQIV